jgi:hypothetical protein
MLSHVCRQVQPLPVYAEPQACRTRVSCLVVPLFLAGVGSVQAAGLAENSSLAAAFLAG